MKKTVLYKGLMLTALSALAFSSCQREEDDLWDKSAAERVNESISIYEQRFSSSKGGWVMEYYPTNSGEDPTGIGYLILADIKADGSVRMAMKNIVSDGVYVEDTSLWQIIRDTGPVLSFNSYNKCIHEFCDPSVYDLGNGLGGDYEFVITDMQEDAQIGFVKGKKSRAYIRMIRLAEGTNYEQYLDSVNNFQATYFSSSAPNKLIMDFAGELKYMDEASTTTPNIYPVNGDPISDENYQVFIISKRDGKMYLRFKDALPVNDEIGKVQEFVWDETLGQFNGVDNPACTIKGENPAQFFADQLNNNGAVWTWNTKSELSDSIATLFTNLGNQFKKVNKNYAFSSMQLKKNTKNQVILVVNYTNNRKATSCSYNFNCEALEHGNVKLTYIEPADNGSANIKNAIEGISQMIDILDGEVIVASNGNNFDLTKVRITPSDAPDAWFVASM